MVANTELQRVELTGWRTGLANLMRRENRAWWGTRRWLVQSVVWALVVSGLPALLVFSMQMAETMGLDAPALEPGDSVTVAVFVLFWLASMALPGGAIVLVHDAVIGERQQGVTEWLLSKPVSRPAYVLSKLFAHGLGVLVILVGLQAAIAYGLLSLFMGEPFPPGRYVMGVAGVAVHSVFYLALALMMGVLTANRNVVLGVSLGVLVGGWVISIFLGTVGMLTPWSLVTALPTAVSGEPLPVSVWVPIGVTAVLTGVCVAVTVARFERLEL
ncbi:MAG: ABC transporter permease subunit [Anaerolineae bacterium]|nr:ABC transporter permease subunit [Anaerolineae bacterium]